MIKISTVSKDLSVRSVVHLTYTAFVVVPLVTAYNVVENQPNTKQML